MTHTLTDPDCPQSVRDQINGAAQPREWHETERTSGDVMLYTLRQDGWRKGEPIMVNDVTIHIEAAHGSTANIEPIVDAIRQALSASASEREALEARVKELEAALKPFSDVAGELFAKNYNDPDIVMTVKAKTEKGSRVSMSLAFKSFRIARNTLAALNGVKP